MSVGSLISYYVTPKITPNFSKQHFVESLPVTNMMTYCRIKNVYSVSRTSVEDL